MPIPVTQLIAQVSGEGAKRVMQGVLPGGVAQVGQDLVAKAAQLLAAHIPQDQAMRIAHSTLNTVPSSVGS